jgi:hypothetical protein
MDAVLPNAQASIHSGWNNNRYAGPYGALDFPEPDLSLPLGDESSRYALPKPIIAMTSRLTSHSLSFADAMSAFTHHEPADRKPDFIDPMSMWPPVPNRACETPSTSSRHDSAYSSAGTPKSSGSAGLEGPRMMFAMPSTTTAIDSFGMAAYPSPVMPPTTTATEGFAPMSVSPRTIHPSSPDLPAPEPIIIKQESDSTCRARYAANQRHQKARKLRQEARESSSGSSDANTSGTNSDNNNNNNNNAQTLTKAEEKKRNLREKNKVAAAKCRQRQRKQAETIRSKGSRLSETNGQLKSYVQELRGELNALRSLALGHGECDERLARYNQVQAERVMREYYSSCGGLAGSLVNGREQQQQHVEQPQ